MTRRHHVNEKELKKWEVETNRRIAEIMAEQKRIEKEENYAEAMKFVAIGIGFIILAFYLLSVGMLMHVL